MGSTFNGWPKLYAPPSTYFTAPNRKRVYCANSDVATVFSYVAEQWDKRIEHLPEADCNIGDPCVRTGYIVIHAYRAPNTNIGTGNRSNHRSATAMDILGDKHPYEATNPPHLRFGGYDDGFTNAQRAQLVKIRNEVGKNSRGMWILRLGIHFPVGLRDGMHVEIAPGVTAHDVRVAAQRIRAGRAVLDLTAIHRLLDDLGYTPDVGGVRAFQRDHGLTVDGIPGPKTTAALEAVMSEVLDRVKDIQNVVNHHIRGDLSRADQKGMGTSRNLPLNERINLTGVRVNTLRARQWDVIKATDAVVDALQRRGATVDADTRAAITAALQED